MAKRKRLSPFPHDADQPLTASLVTHFEPATPATPASPPMNTMTASMAPIASVAAESATRAALDEVSAELSRARREGRMLLSLLPQDIDEGYLVRDRISADPEDLAALSASIRARGQQVPIEVAELSPGRYGLISGWRRLKVLRDLADEGHDIRIQAILRRPEVAASAYLAMVEENEIRSDISFYERARIVVRAAEQGVYASQKEALAELFASAPRARRSKIGSFIRLVRAFEEGGFAGLSFPSQLSEKLGLGLAAALDQDPDLAGRILADLAQTPPKTAAEEMQRLAQFIAPPSVQGAKPARVSKPSYPKPEHYYPQPDRVVIEGPLIEDASFRKALEKLLRDWQK